MGNIICSQLLSKLMQYAKSLENGSGNLLTAERFLVSAMDLLDGKIELETGESLGSIGIILRDAGLDTKGAREIFAAYVKDKGYDFEDDIYMRNILDAASADSAGKLTPELLLMAILANPSKGMRLCYKQIESAGGYVKKVPEKKTKPTGSGFDWNFGAGKKNDPDAQEKTEPERVPEPQAEAEKTKTPLMSLGDTKVQIARLTEQVKDLHKRLSEIVFGQDNAINVFTSGYFRSQMVELTDKGRYRPAATFLFTGSPGVGKSFLAETAGELLGLPHRTFDMSEYCDHESAVEFCGSDSVYKNGKPGIFTSYIEKYPRSIVVLDEIEKAHISIIHLFLQMLDGGRIRDNYTDKELSLKDVIMIFTTNAGKQLYNGSDSGDFSSVSRKVILDALQKDINPANGQPYFPAAICSRFASGNVVMFNRMEAQNLRAIAEKEVLRHAENFQKEFNVKVEIDKRVYTALIFAEGATADARTVRSRAEAFFDEELFELFRLTDAASVSSGVGDIETIRIGVDIPENPEIAELFEGEEKPEVLVFASDEVAAVCRGKDDECSFFYTTSIEDAKKIMRERDIQVVLIDFNYGKRGDQRYLNIEDMDSEARDFFWHLREYCAGIPVYLIQTEEYTYDEEEFVSFLRQGVRGIIPLSDKTDGFGKALYEICENLHQQKSMDNLARANMLVSFETAQKLSEDGKVAEITLFDFEMERALDAEDAGSVLSGVSKPNVKFDDVIGAKDAKKELEYFVQYLKNPRKYLGTGVSAPKGLLMYGPPGTGKTMLAKAMASESDVAFIPAEGNQFLKTGVEGVHDLFRKARKYAPAILFIDEIDAIAKERTGYGGAEDILTAFLTEMDGFKKDVSKPVFVLAATNFDVAPGRRKSLDPALVRRFDRSIYIDLPDRDDRIRFMKKKRSENAAFELSDEKIKNLAIRSTGMSLADLESVFEMSLRMVVREGKLKVTDDVLDEALEIFCGGEEKKWDDSKLLSTARHEAGHALLYWLSGGKPSYVTIVARENWGGYMRHDDEGEKGGTHTKEDLLGLIRTSLGGRAAELVYYGEKDGLTTGAGGDLENATCYAQAMICSYGMTPDFGLAVISRDALVGSLAAEVRQAVNNVLTEEMANTIRLIEENRDKIDRLVEALLVKNHLTGDEILAIFENNDSVEGDR